MAEVPDIIGPIPGGGRPKAPGHQSRNDQLRGDSLEGLEERATEETDPKEWAHIHNLIEDIRDWRSAQQEVQRRQKA